MTTYASATSIKARATDLLVALGDTADTVAATLDRFGCRGKRGACGGCPIAVYLMRSDLGVTDVQVFNALVTLQYRTTEGAVGYTVIDLPAPARAFAGRFDLGEYGGLVATGTEGDAA